MVKEKIEPAKTKVRITFTSTHEFEIDPTNYTAGGDGVPLDGSDADRLRIDIEQLIEDPGIFLEESYTMVGHIESQDVTIIGSYDEGIPLHSNQPCSIKTRFCTADVTGTEYDKDPYESDVHGDGKKVWACQRCRDEVAGDI